MFIPFHSRWLIPAGILIAPLALAIEAPEDDAAPPQVAGEKQAQIDAAHPPKVDAAHPPKVEAMPMQQAAFIGLVSGPIPELLSTHLGIRNGEGVLVRSVMPDGPAATAGIQANDIIVTLDGKSAMSPAELSNIIRSHQPGDKVKVGLIQAGKGTELEVTLGARPERFAQFNNGNLGDGLRVEGMPEDMAKRLQGMIEGNMMHFQFDGQQFKPGLGIPDIQRDMEKMREEMKELREQQMDMLKDGAPMNFNANTTIRLMDDEGSVELSTNNGQSELTVRDKDNKIQWQGPWTTDEDKAKAPEDIRERAGNLKMDGGGFKFDFGR